MSYCISMLTVCVSSAAFPAVDLVCSVDVHTCPLMGVSLLNRCHLWVRGQVLELLSYVVPLVSGIALV